MNKNCILALLFISIFTSCKQKNESLIKVPIINKKVDVIYPKKADGKEFLTFEEIKEDTDIFIYIIESSYVGFEDSLEHGLNTNDLREKIFDNFKNKDNVPIKEYFDFLYNAFLPYIWDCHANVEYNDIYHAFIQKHVTFFTDIYVQKKENNYFVYSSNDKNIKVGDRYESDIDNLFLYPCKGIDIYRIGGIYSNHAKTMLVKFNNKEYEVPIYECLKEENPFEYKVIESDQSVYIKINSFMGDNDNEYESLDNFADSSDKYINKNFIIIDLRGNYGGNDYYGTKFLLNLYNKFREEQQLGNDKWLFSALNTESFYNMLLEWTDVNNPAIKKMIKDLKKYNQITTKESVKIFTESNSNFEMLEKPKFTGKIIILSDCDVASAGESFIANGKYLFSKTNQIYQIGQNTTGCFSYGNICTYYLPNSGIKATFPMTDFSNYAKTSRSFNGEGKGFYPDYWSTDEDLNDTIFYVTGDEEMKSLLKEVF